MDAQRPLVLDLDAPESLPDLPVVPKPTLPAPPIFHIRNPTGRQYDLEIIHLPSNTALGVIALVIEPFTHANGWSPQVTITLPARYCSFDLMVLGDDATVLMEEQPPAKEESA